MLTNLVLARGSHKQWQSSCTALSLPGNWATQLSSAAVSTCCNSGQCKLSSSWAVRPCSSQVCFPFARPNHHSLSVAIFSALQFYQPILDEVPEIGNMVLTVICIFLPLSAIWAGVANDSAVAHRGHDAHHHLINSEFGRGSSTTTTSNSTTAFDKSRQMSCSTCTYTKKCDELDAPKSSSEGKQGIAEDDVILVDREYMVHREAIPLERV